MDIFTTLLIIVLCLLLEGFFSGSEIGVVSADQIKLRHKAAKGSKGARLALKMLEKPEWLLSTTLVGTNISVVTNTTMVTALMIHLFGDYGSWLAIVLAAPLIWIFGEIVPKSVFQQRADSLTPVIIFALRFFSYLFFPILIVFTFLTRLLAKLAGGDQRNPFTLREEIVTMLQMPAVTKGDIQPVEQNMIRRMFNFSETRVQDVMLPLIDVIAVEQGATCGEAREISARESHVRLPVYDQRIDRIIGILHTLDLLECDPQQPIREFIRPAFYIPGSKGIKDLMLEMRKEKTVVDIGGFDENIGLGSNTPYLSGEETDLILSIISRGHRLHYDPSLSVFHPRGSSSITSYHIRRAYAYGLGKGLVLRRYNYRKREILIYCARPVIGAVWAILCGNVSLARFRLARAKGRFEGWICRYPVA